MCQSDIFYERVDESALTTCGARVIHGGRLTLVDDYDSSKFMSIV